MTETTQQENSTSEATPASPPRQRQQPQSRPTITTEVPLQSIHAQRTANRVLRKVSQACYTVQVHLPNIAGRHPDLQPLLKEYADLLLTPMNEFDEAITKALEHIDERLAEAGILERSGYSQPQTLKLEITSPGMMGFSKLLMKLDHLVAGIDTLWLSGNLSDHLRSQESYAWQQRLIKTGNRIIQLGQTTNKRLSTVTAGERSEAESGEDPAAASMPEPTPEEEGKDAIEEAERLVA